jgi:two-component system response regulator AtoC
MQNAIARVLVVSHDHSILRLLWEIGETNLWEFEIAPNAWASIDRVQFGPALDLLLLDLSEGENSLLHILRWLRRVRPTMPVIILGHTDDKERKQESLRMGASEYLVRPIDGGQLEIVIQRNLHRESEAAEINITSEDVEAVSQERFFIGVNSIMRKLRTQAAMLAEVDVPVLIVGEEGSGKETTARLIHRLSIRSGFDFVSVNCAALPADLLESELFGYERTSNGGPPRIRTGKLESYAKGVIFLREIAEMPMYLQSNLVQVLEEKQFTRPGTSSPVAADVRIIAASSRNVEHAISEGKFSKDLHEKLSFYTIHVPPLRERKEEIAILCWHFMHRLAKHYNLSPRELPPGTIETWEAYHWPGNLCELERCVNRYLILGEDPLEAAKNCHSTDTGIRAPGPALVRGASPGTRVPSGVALSTSKSLRSVVQNVKGEAEKNAIAAALERTGWNRKAAARLLKVSYRTVLYKIDQYKMTPPNSSLFSVGNESQNKDSRYSYRGKAV